jgi:hypothetical protein
LNTAILTDALRSLYPEEYTWKFALYGAQKSRDGVELDWNLCNMQDIPSHIEAVLEHLLKKPVADKPVAPYSPFLSDKENIGAMDKSDELIREQVSDIFMNIRNGQSYPPEDFVSGAMPKVAGYAFYGVKTDNESENHEPVLLIRRGNPFLKGSRLYTGTDDGIAPSNIAMLKFTTAVDFLAIGGICYFLSSSIEKDFAFENKHFAIAQKWLDKIVDAEIIGNYENFEKAVMTSKNARKFLDFDNEVLEYIAGLPITERMEYLEKYGVEIDQSGRMDSYDSEQCEFIIDLLCNRSCLDPLGRLSTGSNITIRE